MMPPAEKVSSFEDLRGEEGYPEMIQNIATVLRQSYYEDPEATLDKSEHTDQWTRMATDVVRHIWFEDTEEQS